MIKDVFFMVFISVAALTAIPYVIILYIRQQRRMRKSGLKVNDKLSSETLYSNYRVYVDWAYICHLSSIALLCLGWLSDTRETCGSYGSLVYVVIMLFLYAPAQIAAAVLTIYLFVKHNAEIGLLIQMLWIFIGIALLSFFPKHLGYFVEAKNMSLGTLPLTFLTPFLQIRWWFYSRKRWAVPQGELR